MGKLKAPSFGKKVQEVHCKFDCVRMSPKLINHAVALLVITFAASQIALASTPSNFNPKVICSLLSNGTRIKDPRSCNVWIECIDGQPITGTCDDNLFYDRSTEACVSPSRISCISSDPCAAAAGSNGFVADPYSCNSYYYCNNGTASLGQCSTDMNFNPGTLNCIRNFTCVTTMDPDNYCNIVPDGIFIKNPNNCNGYQMCWNGVVTNGTCPGTFYFDALSGLCNYPDKVDCVEQTSPRPDVSAASVCAQVGDFVPDNRTCNGYYYCRPSATSSGGMELQYGTCPAGRFFVPANGGACVSRTLVVCKFDRCIGLGSPSIQLANESDDNCEGYAICQDGKKIGSGTCPGGEYFDEQKQRCTSEQITFPVCTLPATTAAPNDAETTVTP